MPALHSPGPSGYRQNFGPFYERFRRAEPISAAVRCPFPATLVPCILRDRSYTSRRAGLRLEPCRYRRNIADFRAHLRSYSGIRSAGTLLCAPSIKVPPGQARRPRFDGRRPLKIHSRRCDCAATSAGRVRSSQLRSHWGFGSTCRRCRLGPQRPSGQLAHQSRPTALRWTPAPRTPWSRLAAWSSGL